MKLFSIILLLLSFLFFHFIIWFFISKSLKSKLSTRNKKIIIFISLFLINFGIFFLVLYKSNEMDKTEKLRIYNDSLNTIKKRNLIDSVKYKTVSDRVEHFYKYSNMHLIDSVLVFFVDTVDRYFLLKHIDKSIIKTQIKWYWRTYPNDKFIFDKSNIDTTFFGLDSCLVSVYGENFKFPNKPVNIRTDIKFNKRLKIYHIRSFYDIDIESEMLLQLEQSKLKEKKTKAKKK